MHVINLGNATLVQEIYIVCEICLRLLLNTTGPPPYCNIFFILFTETTMAWYIVFRGRKPEVYLSWGVCSEYDVGFSSAA
jgi:hypothetical protein